MSVSESDVIDGIGVDRATAQVVLTIADHLDWRDEGAHLLALREKFNAYLRFIESGEMEAVYPDAKGRERVICLTSRVAPPPAGLQFLDRVMDVLRTAGVGFRHDVQP